MFVVSLSFMFAMEVAMLNVSVGMVPPPGPLRMLNDMLQVVALCALAIENKLTPINNAVNCLYFIAYLRRSID